MNIASKTMRSISEKVLPKHSAKYVQNSTKYIAAAGVASIVAKDVVGTYFYVTQSLNNEKIPEKTRPFVAALDLANGVLMFATQIAMTLGLVKLQEKMFNGLFGKTSKKNANKALDVLNKPTYKKLSWAKRTNILKGLRNKGYNGFAILVNLVGAAVVAKRLIVPFIATPAASWVKKNILKVPDEQLKISSNKKADKTSISAKKEDFFKPQGTQPQEPQVKITKENAFDMYKSFKAKQ